MKTHIQDPKFSTRALCGLAWERVRRGGRMASDTTPPVVVSDDERASVNVASCAQCVLALRRRLAPAVDRAADRKSKPSF